MFQKSLVALLIVAALGYPVYWFWAGTYPDSRFDIENIRGMTPSEVYSRFGPPGFPAHWTPSTPATADGLPLRLEYAEPSGWMGWHHAIIFGGDGHVVDSYARHK
jgi:hypothetical protein